MIREISDAAERDEVFQRAWVFAKPDEKRLSPDWLKRSDIFCVAQENENHSVHRDAAALSGAFGSMPDSKWFVVHIGATGWSHPAEIIDPARTLLEGSYGALSSLLFSTSFLLFSDTHNAAILYSAPYEYKLIAGSAQFVTQYIEGCEEEPLAELEAMFEEEIRIYLERGRPQQVEAIRNTLHTALSQVKVPPASG